MSYKLYKSHCYNSTQEIANIIESEPFLGNKIVDHTDVYPTLIRIWFVDDPSHFFTPPNCTVLGSQQTYTGLSLPDAQELSWLVVSVLIAAVSFRYLKKVF